MKPEPRAYLFSRDEALTRRIQAYAPEPLRWQCYTDPATAVTALETGPAGLVCIDLRVPNALDHIARWQRADTGHVVIALGTPRSDPVRAAEALDVFATAAFDPERLPFALILIHALDRLGLQQEIARLHQRVVAAPRPAAEHSVPVAPVADTPLPHFVRALRRLENPAALLEDLVEGIAGHTKVVRAGLFTPSQTAPDFTLQAHRRGLATTASLVYAPDHPLVRWLETRAHLITRTTLHHVPDDDERALLEEALDDCGAEIIAPLFARGQLSGWLFLGQRATGIPFAPDELETINALSEHVATTLENARLYEEVNLQKTLAEVLFHSIPIGVVAIDQRAIVRWCNAATEQMLGCAAGPLNQPVAQLGSRLADHLQRAANDEAPPPQCEWTQPATQRRIRIQTHRLVEPGGTGIGAVALLYDITEEEHLKEKEEQVERSTFWTELAASMSHEIRNPLVAIKTFAQLLPERYDDEAFRAEFSKTVTAEVDRLDALIDQINAFANPPPREETVIDLKAVITEAIEAVTSAEPGEDVAIGHRITPHCPPLRGDALALSTGLAHLIRNAVEACHQAEGGRVEVCAEPGYPQGPAGQGENGTHADHVILRVQDNAGGIPVAIQDKLFSPFSTTKARGMGLGLAIARRVAIDHNGQIEVDTSKRGTTVALKLPATE